MLEVDIVKKLGDFILDVDFKIDNKTLALFGSSGCGKSMTLKCIAGIESPDSGSIVLNGRALYDSRKKINLPPQERPVGLLFQSYALFPNMTLRENIEIGLKNEDYKKKVDELIDTFSLGGLESNYPSQLSGGQQQRVALARMLINQPKLLMLDEPFSALDEHLRWSMEGELKNILKTFDLPTLYVSHNKDEVFRVADDIAILNCGKIVQRGVKEDVFFHPRSVHTGRLLGYKNIAKLKIDDETISVPDWNINLKTRLKEDCKYISIDENNLHLDSLPSTDSFEFYVVDIIKSIEDSLLVLARHKSKPVYIKVAREKNYQLDEKVYLSLDYNKLRFFS